MVNRSISATSRTDSDSERVVSYVMLSFTYRFHVFGGRSLNGDRQRRGRNRDQDFDGGERGPRGDGGGFGGGRGGFGGPGGGRGGEM